MDFIRAQEYLEDLKKIFDDAGIKFCLFFGTLLGAMREKDFIEHDHDVDVAIFAKDTDKIYALKEKFRELGYNLYASGRIASSARPASFYIAKKEFHEKVDIYNLFLYKGDRWFIRYVNRKEEGPKEYSIAFPGKFFDNMKTVEFKGKNYLVPTPPEEFLDFLWTNWHKKKGGQIGDKVHTDKYDLGVVKDEEI